MGQNFAISIVLVLYYQHTCWSMLMWCCSMLNTFEIVSVPVSISVSCFIVGLLFVVNVLFARALVRASQSLTSSSQSSLLTGERLY
jgi:hypothetical protein